MKFLRLYRIDYLKYSLSKICINVKIFLQIKASIAHAHTPVNKIILKNKSFLYFYIEILLDSQLAIIIKKNSIESLVKFLMFKKRVGYVAVLSS